MTLEGLQIVLQMLPVQLFQLKSSDKEALARMIEGQLSYLDYLHRHLGYLGRHQLVLSDEDIFVLEEGYFRLGLLRNEQARRAEGGAEAWI